MTATEWHEIIGYAAAVLWLPTFFVHRMVALRSVALAASATWLTYGLLDHLFPVVAVHSVLLPLNAIRLAQVLRRPATDAGASPALDVRPAASRHRGFRKFIGRAAAQFGRFPGRPTARLARSDHV